MRQQAITAPTRRPCRSLSIFLLDIAITLLECAAARQHRALHRRIRRETAAERTACEVRIRLGNGGFLDCTFDAHFTLELDPVEQQRCPRVRAKLACLAAFVIRVEGETALVETF